jgi:hypothetical protein
MSHWIHMSDVREAEGGMSDGLRVAEQGPASSFWEVALQARRNADFSSTAGASSPTVSVAPANGDASRDHDALGFTSRDQSMSMRAPTAGQLLEQGDGVYPCVSDKVLYATASAVKTCQIALDRLESELSRDSSGAADMCATAVWWEEKKERYRCLYQQVHILKRLRRFFSVAARDESGFHKSDHELVPNLQCSTFVAPPACWAQEAADLEIEAEAMVAQMTVEPCHAPACISSADRSHCYERMDEESDRESAYCERLKAELKAATKKLFGRQIKATLGKFPKAERDCSFDCFDSGSDAELPLECDPDELEEALGARHALLDTSPAAKPTQLELDNGLHATAISIHASRENRGGTMFRGVTLTYSDGSRRERGNLKGAECETFELACGEHIIGLELITQRPEWRHPPCLGLRITTSKCQKTSSSVQIPLSLCDLTPIHEPVPGEVIFDIAVDSWGPTVTSVFTRASKGLPAPGQFPTLQRLARRALEGDGAAGIPGLHVYEGHPQEDLYCEEQDELNAIEEDHDEHVKRMHSTTRQSLEECPEMNEVVRLEIALANAKAKFARHKKRSIESLTQDVAAVRDVARAKERLIKRRRRSRKAKATKEIQASLQHAGRVLEEGTTVCSASYRGAGQHFQWEGPCRNLFVAGKQKMQCYVKGCSTALNNCGCNVRGCSLCSFNVCNAHRTSHRKTCKSINSGGEMRCGTERNQWPPTSTCKVFPKCCGKVLTEPTTLGNCWWCETAVCHSCGKVCQNCHVVWCNEHLQTWTGTDKCCSYCDFVDGRNFF